MSSVKDLPIIMVAQESVATQKHLLNHPYHSHHREPNQALYWIDSGHYFTEEHPGEHICCVHVMMATSIPVICIALARISTGTASSGNNLQSCVLGNLVCFFSRAVNISTQTAVGMHDCTCEANSCNCVSTGVLLAGLRSFDVVVTSLDVVAAPHFLSLLGETLNCIHNVIIITCIAIIITCTAIQQS